MTAGMSSGMDSPAGTQKLQRVMKRARDNDPADEGTENQNRNDSHYTPIPKGRKRAKALPSSTVAGDTCPTSVEGKAASAVVDDRPSKSKPKPKQKPGPKPGFKFPTKAESPPPWSWDITGHWTLTCPQLSEILELDVSSSLKMTIRLANNPRHTKDGRQYWATFDFGNGCFIGNMRFCPHVDSSTRDDIDVKDFEKACVLRNGEWVGPPPNGIQKWNLRWRGVDADTGAVERSSDQYQTDIEFKKDEDRELTLSAVFVLHYQPVVLRGVKTGEADPPRGNELTVARQWLRYKPRLYI